MNTGRLDYVYLFSLPLVAALASFAGIGVRLPGLGLLRHTGLMWLLTLFVGILLLVFFRNGRKVTFPWWCWLPFFAWSLISLQWSDMNPEYNIRLGVQMMVIPLIGLIASFSIISVRDVEGMNTAWILSMLFIGAVCCYFMIGPGQEIQGQAKGNYTGFAERPAGASLLFIGGFFLAQFRKRPVFSTVLWAITFVFCIISGGRMVSALLLVCWVVHPKLSSIGAKVAVVGFVCLVAVAAFNTPIIQQRFFNEAGGHAGHGSVDDVASGNFDSSGRFDAWPKILREAHRRPIFGHGLGNSAPFTYKVWAPMDKPHNDYLKVYFESGVIGLAFFGLGLLGTLLNQLYVMAESDRLGIENWPASAAIMGLASFALLAVVDNPLVLGINFLHPLFAMVGAANAICYNAKMGLAESSDDAVLKLKEAQPAEPAARPALVPLR